MFEAKVEGLDELLKKIETFDKQIEELHKEVPQEMVEWQTDDMRRKYPNIQVDETTESVEATTTIWPRSRLEQEPGYQRSYRVPPPSKGPRQVHPKGMGRPPASTRPTLRSELIKKLFDRMEAAVTKAMTWP
jgi:hypothetical protein